MSVFNHSAIANGAAGNAITVNNPLGQLDAAMGQVASLDTTATNLAEAVNEVLSSAVSLAGGTTVTNDRLKEWTESAAYEMTSITLNTTYPGLVSTATVKWPDGSGGTFTVTAVNATWQTISSYTVSHTVSGKTVTQAAITRNASGFVTAKPALTVA